MFNLSVHLDSFLSYQMEQHGLVGEGLKLPLFPGHICQKMANNTIFPSFIIAFLVLLLFLASSSVSQTRCSVYFALLQAAFILVQIDYICDRNTHLYLEVKIPGKSVVCAWCRSWSAVSLFFLLLSIVPNVPWQRTAAW